MRALCAFHGALGAAAAGSDWARRVVAGFAASGGGIFSLDGRMVEAPVLLIAQRWLAE